LKTKAKPNFIMTMTYDVSEKCMLWKFTPFDRHEKRTLEKEIGHSCARYTCM